jgi:hypothetical protein
MNVDDAVKLILAISFSVSMIAVSYQFMRLIGKLADSVQDLRKAIQNVSSASDLLVDDYARLRKVLHNFLDLLENIEESVLSPIKLLTSLIQSFTGKNDKED